MKILVAEDDRVTRRLLESYLHKWGHEAVVCDNGGQAWEILGGDNGPRVAVIDWLMPEMTGIEVCRQLREDENKPYVYIILLTSKGTKENVVEGLDAGADDYIVKPFDPNELKVRVRAGTRITQLQEQLRTALATSEYRASHDLLTGLKNRGAVLESLEMERERSHREKKPLGVLIADVDHFKRVNDRNGHLAGDGVLRAVAKRLESSLRPYDSIGRYGGEEFLIVMPGCDHEMAREVGERLCSAFNNQPLTTEEGEFSITLSFGGTVVRAGAEQMDSIISRADEALYRAKAGGRNRVEMAPKD